MKRNYGIKFVYRGKVIENNTKRYTLKGAKNMVLLIKKAHLARKLKHIVNPRIFRAK